MRCGDGWVSIMRVVTVSRVIDKKDNNVGFFLGGSGDGLGGAYAGGEGE